MKKLLPIIILTLLVFNPVLADPEREKLMITSEKLSNKKLSTQEVLKICKEYESKNIDSAQFDQMTVNTYIGINNYCNTIKMRSEFKQESKYNLVKDLDIEKFNFNYFTSEDFTISIPISEITKSSSCFVNLKEEKVFDYSQILKSCGIKKFMETSISNSCPASGCELLTHEWTEDDELKDNWIIITDYFYADVNKDDYMDLILTIRPDGQYSSVNNTETIIVTSFSKGEFVNTNLEKGN